MNTFLRVLLWNSFFSVPDPSFVTGLFVFLIFRFLSTLYILDIKPLSLVSGQRCLTSAAFSSSCGVCRFKELFESENLFHWSVVFLLSSTQVRFTQSCAYSCLDSFDRKKRVLKYAIGKISYLCSLNYAISNHRIYLCMHV